MRFSLIACAILVVVSALLDLYIYNSLSRNNIKGEARLRGWYLGGVFINFLLIIVTALLPRATASNATFVTDMWLLFAVITVLLAKLAYFALDIWSYLTRLFKKPRFRFMSRIAQVTSLAIIPLMLWAALINRNRVSVSLVDIPASSWPAAAGELTIAHISDLHCGTWGNDTTFVSKLVDAVNNLQPDIIALSGDIVNRQADEMRPFIPVLSRLKARHGIYAVRGNHDYGDYRAWPNDSAKLADRNELTRLYASTPITLLDDTAVVINANNTPVVIAGVQNISHPPYHSYGDLNKALSVMDCLEIPSNTPVILLSHDPWHWEEAIKGKDTEANTVLTLSGHTHAMQVQAGGHTPASLTSDTPWGLYADSLGHYLYVNRGAGTVGLPARLGATPEVSFITLHTR